MSCACDDDEHAASYKIAADPNVPDPQKTDSECIELLSSCPDKASVLALCEHSRNAVVADATNVVYGSKVLSVKDILSRSVLTGGKVLSGGKIQRASEVICGGDFVFVRDKNAPFTASHETTRREAIASNGLIGVLVTYSDKLYGAERVNLFAGVKPRPDDRTEDIQLVRQMLIDFITFRDNSLLVILQETVKHMKSINAPAGSDYDAVVALLSFVGQHHSNPREAGIFVTSFCAAWDIKTGAPRFEFGCPHFLTRLYVEDSHRLRAFLTEKGFTEDVDYYFAAYERVVLKLQKTLAAKAGHQKLINCDKLNVKMQFDWISKKI